MNWKKTKAAIVRNGQLKAVKEIQKTSLKKLFGLKTQKRALKQNTLAFLKGKGANNALLWGEMGCGKSSLVRAVFCKYMDKNLRLIEIGKNELNALYSVLCEIREARGFKFIIFCDDFSFDGVSADVSELKRLLEGSIEKVPSNVLFYATSNRRHLLKDEQNNENFLIQKENQRDNLSLADRFGLQISFYELDFSEYLGLCDELFGAQNWEEQKRQKLHNLARTYSDSKGIRSPRSAMHFYASFKDEI